MVGRLLFGAAFSGYPVDVIAMQEIEVDLVLP
jgi:hypothetical protein